MQMQCEELYRKFSGNLWGTWMHLESITLIKVTQTQKEKSPHFLLHMKILAYNVYLNVWKHTCKYSIKIGKRQREVHIR